ncbi:MAG: chemotaxis protein CheC [Nanobdellota archaeon]
MKDISKIEKDALNEITNMFSYHISMALEKLTSSPVEMAVNNKQFVALDGFSPSSEKSQLMYLGIYSNIQKGGLDGNVLMAFPKNSALLLYDKLVKKEQGTTRIVDDDVKNVLGEIGNMVTGSVLGILNKIFNINCMHSIPTVVPSFGEQLYDFVYLDVDNEHNKAMLIEVETTFTMDNSEVKGQSMLLLTHESFEKLLSEINKKIKDHK